MNLFTDKSSHDWLSFALGVVAGLLTVFLLKLRRRKENR